MYKIILLWMYAMIAISYIVIAIKLTNLENRVSKLEYIKIKSLIIDLDEIKNDFNKISTILKEYRNLKDEF